MYHVYSLFDVAEALCYIYAMSEAKKKQVRKVTVSISNDGNLVGDEVYKIVMDPESNLETELEYRLGYLRDDPGISWHVDSDELIKEVENG